MRHRHGYRKLGRTSSHRKALLKNLSIALVRYGKIETTLEKAKELQRHIEKMITNSREGGLQAHRTVFANLQNKECTKKMVEEIAPNYKERNGGYTRIIKIGKRRGDAAEMATIELI